MRLLLSMYSFRENVFFLTVKIVYRLISVVL